MLNDVPHNDYLEVYSESHDYKEWSGFWVPRWSAASDFWLRECDGGRAVIMAERGGRTKFRRLRFYGSKDSLL